MKHKKKKFIKVTYYKEPLEVIYEVDGKVNTEKLCEDQRNQQTMTQREFEHHYQFCEILNDRWNIKYEYSSKYEYDGCRVEQVEDGDYESPDYYISMLKTGELFEDYSPEDQHLWDSPPELYI